MKAAAIRGVGTLSLVVRKKKKVGTPPEGSFCECANERQDSMRGRAGSWSQFELGWNPRSAVSCCITLSKLPSPVEPQFSHL